MPWEGLLLPLFVLPVVGIILLIQSAVLAIDERTPRGRDGNIVRSCVILGFVILGSVVYWPLLVLLVDPIVSGGNASEADAGLMFLLCLIFVAPFSLLAFLCAFIAHLAVKGAERDQGR